jgi:translocation protein SEC63
MKVTDIPFSKPEQDRDYRSYKLQFQAPNSVGLFTWKVYLVSDTFVGEDICEDIAVRHTFNSHDMII